MLFPFYREGKCCFLRSCSVQRERRANSQPALLAGSQLRSPLGRARDPRLFFSWTSVSDPVGSTHKNVPAPWRVPMREIARLEASSSLSDTSQLTHSFSQSPLGLARECPGTAGFRAPALGAPGPGFLPRSRGRSPLLGPFSETVSAPLLASSAPGPLDGRPRNFTRNAAEGSRVPAAGSVGAQDARLQGLHPGRPGPRSESPAVSESRSSGPAGSRPPSAALRLLPRRARLRAARGGGPNIILERMKGRTGHHC